MTNVYAKAESKIAELEANIAAYRAAGATEAEGKIVKERVSDLYSRIIDGDDAALQELADNNDDLTQNPSYKLNEDLRELEGLQETMALPLAKIGSTRYLITNDANGLISPAGYWDDGVFVKNDVWIETNRLPRSVGAGLCVYDVQKVLGEAA